MFMNWKTHIVNVSMLSWPIDTMKSNQDPRFLKFHMLILKCMQKCRVKITQDKLEEESKKVSSKREESTWQRSRGTQISLIHQHSSIEARRLGIPGILATEWQKRLQGPMGTTQRATGMWLWIGRDQTAGICMEGRDLFLWRDKRKRKRGCGNVGLYLDKRKTMDQEHKKWRRNQFLTQSRGVGLSPDWYQPPCACAEKEGS